MHSTPGMRAPVVGVVLLIVLVDQVSKLWIIRTLPLWHSHPLLPPVLQLTRVENRGAAFSLFPGGQWLFVAVAVGMLVAAWGWRRVLWSRESTPAGWGAAVVIGGTIGNLIDRLRWGYVVDFLELPHFPVFNVADACITVGMGLVLLGLLRWTRSTESSNPPDVPDAARRPTPSGRTGGSKAS